MGKKMGTAETISLNVRIPMTTMDELDELASLLGTTKSDILKTALRQYIDSKYKLILIKDLSKALKRTSIDDGFEPELLDTLYSLSRALSLSFEIDKF